MYIPFKMAHVCNICNKNWSEKNLLRHIRSVHERSSYSCTTCGRSFARSDYLCRQHQHRYTGELLNTNRSTNHITVAAQVGDCPWTPDTNLLLVAPAVLCGLQYPAWWNCSMALQHLKLDEGREFTDPEGCTTRSGEGDVGTCSTGT